MIGSYINELQTPSSWLPQEATPFDNRGNGAALICLSRCVWCRDQRRVASSWCRLWHGYSPCFVSRCTPKTQLSDITLAPQQGFDNLSIEVIFFRRVPPIGHRIETPTPISYRFHAVPAKKSRECGRLSRTSRTLLITSNVCIASAINVGNRDGAVIGKKYQHRFYMLFLSYTVSFRDIIDYQSWLYRQFGDVHSRSQVWA